jgi:hypothetical protein
MLRPVLVVSFLALSLQVAQAQLFSHGGAPASVMSPTPDGRQHGVPASVLSPTPLPFGVNPPLRPGVRIHGPLRRFGNPHGRTRAFVPVPVFYAIYTDGAYPSFADPFTPEVTADQSQAQQQAQQQPQQQSADRSDEELQAAYLQGARDALTQQRDTLAARQSDSRYGEHYLDSRERRQEPAPAAKGPERKTRPDQDTASAPVPTPVEDKSPATVFIFKDGHQLETRNYAIMGGTLFDFSGQALKKIQIEDLDSAATLKANDDRGILVKLP